MRPAIALLLLVSVGLNTANADVEDQTFEQILSRSDDYLSLARQYWPKAGEGDALAMSISYEALNSCIRYKDEISAADNVYDLEASLTGRWHPTAIHLAMGVYSKCKRLVEHYAEFPDWETLRFRAAVAGDMRFKTWMAIYYYENKNRRPREYFSYSPGEFLTDAMTAGHPTAFNLIAHFGPHTDILQDKSLTTVVAWSLLSCKYRDDCATPESLLFDCMYTVPECVGAVSAFDLYRRRAGSEEIYTAAQVLADELYIKVQHKRFEELGLNLVW